jgi:nicotinamide mononucleotide (NMN) deamidase PncC
LFRFLGHLPDGRNRIEVYSDLLQIVPRQYEWQPKSEVVPGALIEAVADSPAASHLQRCATDLEAGLVQMPFQSESALIGLAAHMFQDFAARAAVFDEGVVLRSNQARAKLLGLADVKVDRPQHGLAASSRPAAAERAHGWGI